MPYGFSWRSPFYSFNSSCHFATRIRQLAFVWKSFYFSQIKNKSKKKKQNIDVQKFSINEKQKIYKQKFKWKYSIVCISVIASSISETHRARKFKNKINAISAELVFFAETDIYISRRDRIEIKTKSKRNKNHWHIEWQNIYIRVCSKDLLIRSFTLSTQRERKNYRAAFNQEIFWFLVLFFLVHSFLNDE